MRYEPALDGLRAVAVSAVMVSHIWEKQAPGGHVGVDVFFVLSGFLITSILQREALTTGRDRLRAVLPEPRTEVSACARRDGDNVYRT